MSIAAKTSRHKGRVRFKSKWHFYIASIMMVLCAALGNDGRSNPSSEVGSWNSLASAVGSESLGPIKSFKCSVTAHLAHLSEGISTDTVGVLVFACIELKSFAVTWAPVCRDTNPQNTAIANGSWNDSTVQTPNELQ